MKRILLFAGMIFALTGLTSCEFDVDEDSLVGEWGLLNYTFTTRVKVAQSERPMGSMGGFYDPTARSYALIFKEDGSGENIRYGYYADEEYTQFENDYYSYPFTWSINDGKLFLNYPGESPMDPEEETDPSTSTDYVIHSIDFFPVGTEFDMKIIGGKLLLECDQTTDSWEIQSSVKLERK